MTAEQVLYAYTLHSGPILSFAVHSGYAVTGGHDRRLRIWPLDFSDFLLEAVHEAPVSNVRISKDGRKLAVGTASGTVGVLDVSEHSYSTILRSHTARILSMAVRGSPQEGLGSGVGGLGLGLGLAVLPPGATPSLPPSAQHPNLNPNPYPSPHTAGHTGELATCGLDRTIRLWDVPSGTQR